MHSSIEHVFVLQLENRSFDHMLGHRRRVDGIDHGRTNADLAGERYAQLPMLSPSARVFEHDPPHDAHSIAVQMSDGMSGFVREFERRHDGLGSAERAEVMKYLLADDAPVTNFLADHFAISDRWFAALPAGTIPNRLYSMCAHSAGLRDNPRGALDYARGLDIDDSIFHALTAEGISWRVYSGTFAPWVALIRSLRRPLYRGLPDDRGRKLASMARFVGDLKRVTSVADARSFPAFVWLEPVHVWTDFALIDPLFAEPNDDHPSSDVFRGQELIAQIYAAIRGCEPIWRTSVLVITYDEHGGFYDHVPPPPCVAGADFFQRRGPRVPALVISPFVERDAVVRPHDGAPERAFDHCSILKFVCERFGLPRWRPRLEASSSTASLADFLRLSSPRHDAPPEIPPEIIAMLRDRTSTPRRRARPASELGLCMKELERQLYLDESDEGLAGWRVR